MIYVGINITKLTHNIAVLSSNGALLPAPYKFTNDGERFHRLSEEISDNVPNLVIIDLEAMAFYGENLVHFIACLLV